jgi:mRNA degradation ribonuclease J1/J2
MDGLKPCPFCGGEAARNTVTYSERMVSEQHWEQSTFHGVNCIVCGVTNVGMVGHATPERAAERWNRRTITEADHAE